MYIYICVYVLERKREREIEIRSQKQKKTRAYPWATAFQRINPTLSYYYPMCLTFWNYTSSSGVLLKKCIPARCNIKETPEEVK